MIYTLDNANRTLCELKSGVNDRWYPAYHLAPQVGWMNDPNGLAWFDGYYHVFFQHCPYSPNPAMGPRHWGHARSKDMVNWEHLPIVLAPEGVEDKDGCYSGSAVVDGAELALIYTGHKFHGEECEENLYQVQCLATSRDGVNFERQGIILDTPQDVNHFRDPKVWKEDGFWYMVLGARVEDTGVVQLYRSTSLRQWEFLSTVGSADDNMGYMWECPDFFKLGDKQVLMFSPQGLEADGYQNRNIFQSGYLIGEWRNDGSFDVQQPFLEMDHGHDFYAPQSFLSPDGRRIVYGWLGAWESPMPEEADLWAGMLTLPRELTLDEKQCVRMNPVQEILALRKHENEWKPFQLTNEVIDLELDASACEVEVTFDLENTKSEKFGFQLGQGLQIYVDDQSKRLVLDRHYPEYGLSGYRSVPLSSLNRLSLRIFFDQSSVEVFVNQGEFTLSSRIYPNVDDRKLSLASFSGNVVIKKLTTWQLDSNK